MNSHNKIKYAILFILIISASSGILYYNIEGYKKLIFEFCNKNIEDYTSIKSTITKEFPIGSSGKKLEQAISNSKGYNRLWYRKKTLDLLYGLEKRFLANMYTYNCDAGNKNVNQWNILFLTDMENNITALEFYLFFEDEDFNKRGIPFKNDNFRKHSIAKKALWSITGIGTSREKVRQIMVRGGVTEHNESKGDGYVADVYRIRPDIQNLADRLGGDGRNFIWKFNLTGRLFELEVR